LFVNINSQGYLSIIIQNDFYLQKSDNHLFEHACVTAATALTDINSDNELMFIVPNDNDDEQQMKWIDYQHTILQLCAATLESKIDR
jgi:hypothetical protein